MADIDVIQALFDTKPLSLAMNWPVDVARFVHAIKELRALCQDEQAPAEEIAPSVPMIGETPAFPLLE